MWQELFERVLGLLTWIVMVPPWERALRVRLGKHLKLLAPGVHLRVPGMDQIYRQPVRRRICVLPAQTLTTLDSKTVSLSGALAYSILDLVKLYSRLHEAQETIEMEVAGVVAGYVTTHTLAECAPAKLEPAIKQQLRLARYGLGHVDFQICSFAVVRTYRVITGGFKEWQRESISTTWEEGSAD